MIQDRFILVVEDDTDDAELILAALSKISPPRRVQWEKGIQTAMEHLAHIARQKTSRPAAVVCDLRLPGGDGLDFLVWLRASKEFHSVPFVIVTGASRRSDWQNALSLGATCFVNKETVVTAPARFARTIEACCAKE